MSLGLRQPSLSVDPIKPTQISLYNLFYPIVGILSDAISKYFCINGAHRRQPQLLHNRLRFFASDIFYFVNHKKPDGFELLHMSIDRNKARM
jgi:hypothetical protein